MPTLAILGAGELGGALAYTLARRQWTGDVILIDDAGTVAAGKALDMVEAAPIDRSDTFLTGSGDVDRSAGADIIVVADRVNGGEWNGDGGLALLKRVAGMAPRAPIVCAGASQAPLMESAVRELRLDRRRIVGSAPAALESAVRAIVAAELNAAASDISLFVAGVPPKQISVAWSSATLHGQAIAAFLEAHRVAHIDAGLPALWPPGPLSLASAASRVCEALVRGSRGFLTSFVVIDRDIGSRGRAAALPVRVGARGVTEITVPALSTHERVRLENALAG